VLKSKSHHLLIQLKKRK